MRIQWALFWLVAFLLYAFFCAGAYLSVPFVRLIGILGITQFVILLVGATAAMAVLFLLDWEKLSDRYKRVNRDLWFMFVKGAFLGLAAGICLVWITLFKLEILPFKYIWIFFVILFVFVWLMDRKAKSQKHKSFPDADDVLKRKQ